jgi:hypothetical protein
MCMCINPIRNDVKRKAADRILFKQWQLLGVVFRALKQVCVCVYVYVRVCVYCMCMCVCVYAYVCVYVYTMYVCVYVCISSGSW